MTDFNEETLIEEYKKTPSKTILEFIEFLEDNNHTFLGEDIDVTNSKLKRKIKSVIKDSKKLTQKTPQEKWEDNLEKVIKKEGRRLFAPTFNTLSLTIAGEKQSGVERLINEVLQEKDIRVRVIDENKYNSSYETLLDSIKIQVAKAKEDNLRADIPMLTRFRSNLDKVKRKADVKESASVSIRKPLSVDSFITKEDIMKIFSIEATIQESSTREAIYKFWDEVNSTETGTFENALGSMIEKIEKNEKKYVEEIDDFRQEIKDKVDDLLRQKEDGDDTQFDEEIKRLNEDILDYEQVSTDFTEHLRDMKSALLEISSALYSSQRKGYLYEIPLNTGKEYRQPLETVVAYVEAIVDKMNSRIDGDLDFNYGEDEESEEVRGGTKQVKEGEDAEDVIDSGFKTSTQQYLAAIQREIDDFEDDVVDKGIDPLLAYDMEKNDTLVTLSKKMKDVVIRELDKRRNVVLFQPEALKFLDDKIEELGKTLSVVRPSYYLPIFYIRDRDFFDSLDPKIAKEMEKIDNEFSKSMENFQDSLVKAFGFKPKKVRDRKITTGGRGIGNTLNPDPRDKGSKAYRELQVSSTRRTGKKFIESETLRGSSFKEFRKDLKEFATAYEEYMIDPFRSSRNVIVAPRHIQNITTAILEFVQKDEDEADVDLFNMNPMTMTTRTKLGMEDLMTSKEIYSINNLLQYVVKGFSTGFKDDEGRFQYRLQDARQLTSALNDALRAFKQKVTPKLSTEEIANQLSTVIMTNIRNDRIAEAIGNIEFKGKKISERRDISSSSSNIIASLRVHIAELRPEYEDVGGLSAPIDGLYELLTEIATDMGMPLVYKLLKGYDSVRGMLGKEVIYNHIPLSYNGIDYFLDNNSYDLSHLEVENIVKSLDSHENLSKEYGVKADDVYLIKANFR